MVDPHIFDLICFKLFLVSILWTFGGISYMSIFRPWDVSKKAIFIVFGPVVLTIIVPVFLFVLYFLFFIWN